MNALKELPEKDKNILLPLILMRGWVGSAELQNSLDKIEEVYGDRPWLVDIDPDYHPTENVRPVHASISELKKSDDGYNNWCDFITSLPNAIPCLQLMDLDQLAPQITKLVNLNRGIAVRFTPEMQPVINNISNALLAFEGLNPLIILDYGHENGEVLTKAATTSQTVKNIHAVLPNASIVICVTTFPFDFVGRPQQNIFERLFFELVKNNCQGIPLIYGDRGSARAKSIGGGGGTPAPRIDYPLSEEWKFFRKDEEKPQGYINAAAELMASEYWNPNLKVWGTQLIERAAKGDKGAISSPAKSTAVRINIHMHMQLYYGAPLAEVLDTDDEWVD